MNLIVETDIGRDADDFFALLYLIAAGVNIKAVTITPGDPDQIAVAKFLLKTFKINAPVGIPNLDRKRSSCTPFHTDILAKMDEPVEAQPDGLGCDIIKSVRDNDPNVELFIIGPMTNVGRFIKNNPSTGFVQATMQGGYCSYDIQDEIDPNYDAPWRREQERLEKFVGQKTYATFNLNGDKDSADLYIAHPGIKRRFIGKNVCHSIVYDANRESHWTDYCDALHNSEALQLLKWSGEQYFRKHPEKKFHDPCAAVCMMHPEIAVWAKGKPYRESGKWGTKLDPNGDDVCIELDREKLWHHLMSGT